MKLKNRIKKIALMITTIAISVICLTGCSERITIDLSGQIQDRVEDNLSIVEALYQSGLITKEMKNTYIKSIEVNAEQFEQMLRNPKKNKTLVNAITGYQVIDRGVLINAYGWTVEDIRKTFETNKDTDNIYAEYFLSTALHNLHLLNNIPAKTAGSTLQPIVLVNNDISEQINQRLSYNVWVLRQDLPQGTTIKDVYEAINKAKDNNLDSGEDETKTVNSIMEKYFIELKDENGNPVPLIDTSKPENQIVRPSRDSYYRIDDSNKVITAFREMENDEKMNESAYRYKGLNTAGYDLLIYNMGIPNVAFRLVEFNREAYDNIVGQVGLDKNKYMLVGNEGDTRAYLLQYPIGYVSGFELSEDNNQFEARIEKSMLEVNLMTGNTLKSGASLDYIDGTTQAERDKLEKEEQKEAEEAEENKKKQNSEDIEIDSTVERYVLMDSKDQDNISYMIYGSTGLTSNNDPDPWDLSFGATKAKASIPRIVIRDYLEATYSPGIVSNEDIVAFGRMIRLLRFEGSITDTVARYVDAKGRFLGNDTDSVTLKVSNFSDFDRVSKKEPYNMHLPESKTESIQSSGVFEANMHLPESETENKQSSEESEANMKPAVAPQKISDLPMLVTNEFIRTTEQFPGTKIAKADYDGIEKNTKPVFYAMLTNLDVMMSGTMNWILKDSYQDTDSAEVESIKKDIGVGSLQWWNQWLIDHTFIYQVSTNRAADFLIGSYSFELGEEGIFIVNLDTIAKIQSKFDDNANKNMVATLRAFVRVMGYFFIGYSVLIVLAWIFDTTISPGVQLLQRVTFGRMIAVASEKEIPNCNETVYTGFQSIILAAVVYLIIGIILVKFDVLDLVYLLTKTVGSVSVLFEKIIKLGIT